MVALCNACGKQSSMIPKVKVMRSRIKHHYFTCDHCNHIYTIGYTNEEIDRERNRVSKMTDQDKIQTKVKQIETMMSEIKIEVEGG